MDQFIIPLFILVLILGILFLMSLRQIFSLRGVISALKSKSQSQSTKYGQITQQFMPWASNYPYEPAKYRFIGSPIDGIQFEEDKVVLMEFKASLKLLSIVLDDKISLIPPPKVGFKASNPFKTLIDSDE